MYFQNAYSIYDYYYVDELDDTNSFGPVWGRIGENKFKPKLLTSSFDYDYLTDEIPYISAYKRIAGYADRYVPSYMYFY